MAEQLYEVLRPFQGDKLYAIGEIVKASKWRYERQLVESRYIKPIVTPVTDESAHKPDIPAVEVTDHRRPRK